MKKHTWKSLFVILLTLLLGNPCGLLAQYPVRLHSHNDYANIVPFYLAYSQHMTSIECDMYYQNGTFLVGHSPSELTANRTFENLYLNPVLTVYEENHGRAWGDSEERLQLLLEVKSGNLFPYVRALHKRLKRHPQVFDPSVNPYAVRIVLTGCDVPSDSELQQIPSYILFDGAYGVDYSPMQWERIYMVSTNLSDLTRWNGKGTLVKAEAESVRACIRQVHEHGKPIRFWGAPDGPTAWNTLYVYGVDYVGTDQVTACAAFFANWHNKNYEITPNKQASVGSITRTHQLDKTTHAFQGFDDDKIRLSQRLPLYTPTYRNDGTDLPVKNVILLIGDGMGLNQLAAANYVNFGLSTFFMQYIGLLSNHAKDATTTDSAASGSALATGEQHANRHISMSEEGVLYPSLTDFFFQRGLACGVVTLGNVADATPAAFYGHNTERDYAQELTQELLAGKLTLLAGSGVNEFTQRSDGSDFIASLERAGYDVIRTIDEIPQSGKKVICLDETMGDAADTNTVGLLAQATHHTIEKLVKESQGNGFFLMVEGAKIDYAGHACCLPGSIVETLSFDAAVQEALRFADSNGETLVLVTADHETGGLTLLDGDNATGHLTACYVTNDHTPTLLPLFAYGPQAIRFIGKYPQYEVARRIRQLFETNLP